MELYNIIFLFTLFSSITTLTLSYDTEFKNDSNLSSIVENSGCHTGQCKKAECNCCPGYGLLKGGIFFQHNTCKKCNCGGNYNCTIDGDYYTTNPKRKCICPSGYVENNGVCKIKCEDDNSCKGNKMCNADKFCECKNGYEGNYCEVISGCKELKSECDRINADCIFDEKSVVKAICKCKRDHEYDPKTNRCRLMEAKCQELFPNCMETGGLCTLKEDNHISCTCPDYKRFIEGAGCQVKCEDDNSCKDNRLCNADKYCECKSGYEGNNCDVISGCKELKSQCDRINAECIFDEKSVVKATCKCERDEEYNPKINRCRLLDEVCLEHNPSCKMTGGSCERDIENHVFCVCPENTKYIMAVGCKGLEETCKERNPKCIETGGTCILAKDKGILCKCPADTVFQEQNGCLDPCLNVTCFNGGSCKNGKCECVLDFKGDKCEIYSKIECEKSFKECAETKGTCVKIFNDPIRCVCPEGAHFVTSKGCKGPCLNVTCFNGGLCRYGNCECTLRFTGDKCEMLTKDECKKTFKECAETEGTCVSFSENIFRCQCPEGAHFVKNKGCQDKCATIKCYNGGKCFLKNGTAICNCTDRFTGNYCEKDKCSNVTCLNGGNCIIKEGKVTCNCTDNYTGKFCQTDLTSMEDSDIHISLYFHDKTSSMNGTKFDFHFGRKENSNRTRTHLLLRLISDSVKPISDRKCSNITCKNGGVCIIENEKAVCNCTDKYTGDYCEKDLYNPCLTNPCKNGAHCEKNEVRAKCVCLPGYSGELCQYDRCSLIKCQNGGKCHINHGKAFCECVDMYSGDFCELDKCSLMKCLNGGKCEIINKKTACVCDDNFTGDFCERGI